VRLKRRVAEVFEEQTGIDLAPMLDFVLNLLIFFIISATFAREIGIGMSNPSSKATQAKESGSLLISIGAAGEVMVDRRLVDLRAVRANVERYHSEKPEDIAVVAAHRDAPTGVLIQVVDHVKLGGIDNIAFAASKN
jgi:biopolymer transport protein ExbD